MIRERAWAAFFSPGSGFLNLSASIHGYGLTVLQHKATTRIPFLISDLTAIGVYVAATLIDWPIAIVLFISHLIGSYIGSHVALKKGDAWMKPLMGVVIVITAVRLLWY